MQYAKNVFFDMKTTVSGLTIQIFELLDEDYCYEVFYTENSLLVTCSNDLIDAFVFDPFLCLHYCKRRYSVFITPWAVRSILEVVKLSNVMSVIGNV